MGCNQLHNFKSFENNLRILESLGDGTETFTEKLEMYGKLRNLDLYGCPSVWGEEIETAVGELTYSVELEVDRNGIESINFSIEKISLELEVVTGYDKDEYPIMKNIEYVVNKTDIKTEVKTVVHSLPFYLNNLEIDFKQAENLDGDFLPEKVKFEMEIGKIEQ